MRFHTSYIPDLSSNTRSTCWPPRAGSTGTRRIYHRVIYPCLYRYRRNCFAQHRPCFLASLPPRIPYLISISIVIRLARDVLKLVARLERTKRIQRNTQSVNKKIRMTLFRFLNSQILFQQQKKSSFWFSLNLTCFWGRTFVFDYFPRLTRCVFRRVEQWITPGNKTYQY